jgi:hypothetical protein
MLFGISSTGSVSHAHDKLGQFAREFCVYCHTRSLTAYVGPFSYPSPFSALHRALSIAPISHVLGGCGTTYQPPRGGDSIRVHPRRILLSDLGRNASAKPLTLGKASTVPRVSGWYLPTMVTVTTFRILLVAVAVGTIATSILVKYLRCCREKGTRTTEAVWSGIPRTDHAPTCCGLRDLLRNLR